jgi:hypothetical protein
VDFADEIRLGKAKLLEARAEEDAAFEELRPHRAVDDERACGKSVEELRHFPDAQPSPAANPWQN